MWSQHTVLCLVACSSVAAAATTTLRGAQSTTNAATIKSYMSFFSAKQSGDALMVCDQDALQQNLEALDTDATCTDVWPGFLDKLQSGDFQSQSVDDQVKVGR